MFQIENKLFLITGGTSGMGLEAARKLISLGGKVIITGRDTIRLDAARAELGENCVALENDSGSADTGKALFERTSLIGSLDGMWLNSAIARICAPEEITPELYEELMNINVRGPFLQMAALSPLLREGASVVVTSSSSVYEGAAAASLYAASKGAILAAARSWATALAGRNIRVNTLAPGPISTGLRDFLPENTRQAFEKSVIDAVPLARVGKAAEAAR